MTKAAALETIRDSLAKTETRIVELERHLSVTMIDDTPFVVVMDEGRASVALKHLGNDRWNFTAMGLDAAQFSRRGAEKAAAMMTADGRPSHATGKNQWFREQLESAREIAQMMREALEREAA